MKLQANVKNNCSYFQYFNAFSAFFSKAIRTQMERFRSIDSIHIP
jgi:hypothetical protein